MMPAFVVTLLLSGLYCPVGAAALGVVYTVGRYYYFKGYATGVPDNRLTVGYSSSVFSVRLPTVYYDGL